MADAVVPARATCCVTLSSAEVVSDQRLLNIARSVIWPAALPLPSHVVREGRAQELVDRLAPEPWPPVTPAAQPAGVGALVRQGRCTHAIAPAHALERVLALRLHLDDSRTDNGPLRVIPESHRYGVLSEREVARLASERASVTCCMLAGGIIAMRPLLLHASSKAEGTSVHDECFTSNMSLTRSRLTNILSWSCADLRCDRHWLRLEISSRELNPSGGGGRARIVSGGGFCPASGAYPHAPTTVGGSITAFACRSASAIRCSSVSSSSCSAVAMPWAMMTGARLRTTPQAAPDRLDRVARDTVARRTS